MGLPVAITGKCKVIFTICILLLASLPTSALLFSFKVSAQEEPSIREPTELYVGANWGFWYGPDAGGDIPMMVWNRTKQLGELADLSNYGEYSVFISEHAFRYGDSGPYDDEWFVIASTLQPDNNGTIHQLALLVRYNLGVISDTPQISFPLLKSYAENYSFNQTSIEDERNIIRAVIANESLDPSVLPDADFLVNYPFLTVLPENAHWAGVGATAILNLCTGKVMLVALTDTSQFSGESRMLYPDRQPPSGAGIFFDWGYRLGDSANGMICISVSAYSLGYVERAAETEDLPWYYVPITEVRVNGTKVENTSPQLPLTIPPLPHKIAINITMMVNPGDTFIVTFVSSNGEIFIRDFGERELHVPILVCLSVSDVTFYVENGTRKSSFDLSNTGSMNAEISKVLIGKSLSALQNQIPATFVVDSGATRTVIADFDWTYPDTYYFEVLCSSGESLNWSAQAPFNVLFSIEPQTVNVEEGDVFNVTVREFEPMPIENERVNNGIAGIEFRLTWTSSILNAVKMTDVVFHAAAPENEWDNIWQLRNRIDNTLGTAEYAVTWQDQRRASDGGYAPIFGNNTVAIVTLKAVGAGSTPIHFSVLNVGNPEANPIYNVTVDGNVNVDHVTTGGSGDVDNGTGNDTKDYFLNENVTQLQSEINNLVSSYDSLNTTFNDYRDSTQKELTFLRSTVYLLIAVSAVFAAATAYLAVTKTKPKVKRENR